MRPFLGDFLMTLTTRRQARVGDLVNDAIVGKDQLDALQAQLDTKVGEFSTLVLDPYDVGDSLISSRITGNFRDVQLRISELFAMSNSVSLMLDSHTALLASDVKAVEDELIAMEKMAANYAFLLGDGKAYDYAFLEPFNDEAGRDVFEFPIPDRVGLSFGSNDNAIVLADQGVLSLTPQSRNYGITGFVLKSNVSAFMNEESAFANLYTKNSATGWSTMVRVPGPVITALPEAAGKLGAQVMLEFYLSQPSGACQILLAPMADLSLELLQVTVYPDDDDSNGVNLLHDTEVRSLNSRLTLSFPLQTVSRFRVLLNQPVYDRRSIEENTTEQQAHAMLSAARARRARSNAITNDIVYKLPVDSSTRRYMLSLIRRLAQTSGDDLNDRMFKSSVPSSLSNGGVFDDEYLLKIMSAGSLDGDKWNPSNPVGEAFYAMAMDRIPELRQHLSSGWADRERVNPDASADTPTFLPPPVPPPAPPAAYEYRYHIGLSRVAIGVDSPIFKGVFVSKPLDAVGDVGAVRMKAADTNYVIPGSDRDSGQVTSVEYSVSNVAQPSHETDWLPILPVDVATVAGERLLPDNSGNVFLRFTADPQASIRLYRNGRVVPVQPEGYIQAAGSLGVIGVTLPVIDFGADDIFTVDYTPQGDPTTISFETRGFTSSKPLVTAYDELGAGEGYSTTYGRNEVALRHAPYIDPDEVAGSFYSPLGGHIPYNPIVVQLSDRRIAVNLTNYGAGQQGALPLPDQGYYFVNSGKTLLFNQSVSNFRVFYQYLQNSVRFRTVLRVNDKNFVSPSVDFVHIKAKTRRPNCAEA